MAEMRDYLDDNLCVLMPDGGDEPLPAADSLCLAEYGEDAGEEEHRGLWWV